MHRTIIAKHISTPLEHRRRQYPRCGHLMCKAQASGGDDKMKIIRQQIENGKVVVAQIAPAARVAIGEGFDLLPGDVSPKQIVTILKQMGFSYVFDTNFAADLTILEEGTEFIERLKNGSLNNQPLFTSCCPGGLELVEKSYPEIKPYISTCKSPQMMMGAIVKTFFVESISMTDDDIYMVSVMPCVKKQSEADRIQYKNEETGVRHVDLVITTSELGSIIKQDGVIPNYHIETEFDNPMGIASGGGAIFGRTGGVMLAALRFVHQLLTFQPLPPIELKPMETISGVQEACVTLTPVEGNTANLPPNIPITIKIAIVVGLGDAKKFIKKVQSGEIDHQFVEVMACAPAGCIWGGGQPPVGKNKLLIEQRKSAINNIDTNAEFVSSNENPYIKKLYADYIGEPCGKTAKKLLHDHPPPS